MDNQIIKKERISKKDIIINYFCVCKKRFYPNNKISFILPCNHMFHHVCLKSKKSISGNNYCPICDTKIKSILTEEEIFSNKKYGIYQTDIKSVRIINSGEINYLNLPIQMGKFYVLISNFLLAESQKDVLNLLECLLKVLNININIIDHTSNKLFDFENNKIKWKSSNKKIIIANHSNYLDVFVLYYLFRCGFVASEFVIATQIGRLLSSCCKLLIFKRGVDTNMVEKIKEYLNEMKEIIIFPEGVMKENNDTLIKFRTGAFYTGADIYPVVIKYHEYIHDEDMKECSFKLLTQSKITVDVNILEAEYPPFDGSRIENIRKKMGKVGNFKLSRTSNK